MVGASLTQVARYYCCDCLEFFFFFFGGRNKFCASIT
jgi:hypothetical protein